jgi:purine nucleosidase
MTRRRIIIDTDPGQDDAVALLLAFANRTTFDIRLVSTVAGNVELDKVTRNALRIRDLAGAVDVPVMAGMAGPMLLPLETAAYISGPDGLSGADLPEPAGMARDGHAVDGIIAELRASAHGKTTVCALGPLTNIAMALRLAPDIASRVDQLVIMGGAMGLGNVTPAAEFNFYVDPHAAAVVMGAGIPVTLFGLNVTHQALAGEGDLARLKALGTGVGRAVHGMLTRPRPGGFGTAAHPMHDPCVIAWLLWPELFEGRDCHVAIELAEGVRGRSTIDWNGRLKRPPNAFVVNELKRADLFERMIASLAALP